MNNVVLIGHISTEPELRFAQGSGKAVCKFNLAVNRPFSKNNEADFFRVVVFGKTAESTAQYTAKGLLVGVEGRIKNNNWEDDNGIKHYGDDIIADRVEFLEWKNKNSSSNDSDFDDGFNQVDDSVPF